MSKINQLSLKRNFSWNFIGSLIYSFSQFLIMVILAKLGSPTTVGLYSLGLAITAPIISLTNLQLRQVQATDPDDVRYNFNDYLGLRITTGFIMLILTIMVITLGGYNLEKSIIILLVGLTKIFDSYSDVTYGKLQQRERMDYVGKSRIIKGIITIIVMTVCLFSTSSLLFSLVILNLSWFLIFCFYDKRTVELFIDKIKPSFSIKKFKELTMLTFPLGLALMLGSLNTNLPRIFVERYLGEASLGYFAAIAYLLVAGNIFIQAIGQATTPRMSKLYRNNSFREFKKILMFLIGLGSFIGLVGVFLSLLFGDTLLTILYDSTYAEYNYLLVLIMVAGIFTFSNSFLGYTLTSMRLFRIQPYIGGVSVIVTLVTSFILIPLIGLKGAAYALIITSILRFILNLFIIIINIRSNQKLVSKG